MNPRFALFESRLSTKMYLRQRKREGEQKTRAESEATLIVVIRGTETTSHKTEGGKDGPANEGGSSNK